MFNGIVESTGLITATNDAVDARQFIIKPTIRINDLSIGESIAVNGVCLTVTEFKADHFKVTVVAETLRVSNLKHIRLGDNVNLERSLMVSGRISGHFVQGHVDGCGQLISIEREGPALLAKIKYPHKLSPYLVNKGFVAIDGMSITIIEVSAQWFSVTFIPHTQQVTIIGTYKVGQEVNIEVDILSKYVQKILGEKINVSLP
jgi:riboflavin synthase